MDVNESHHVVGYVDASFTTQAAGAGFVARIGERVYLGCRPLEGMTSSGQAEARAALILVERVLACPVPPSRIDLSTDSQDLITKFRIDALAMPVDQPPPVPAYPDVPAMRALSQAVGTTLSLRYCKGHSPSGFATAFLNHAADRLSVLGAAGNTLSWDCPFDAFWRMRVMGCHPALRCEGIGLTRDEAVDYLGVGPDVVDRLIRHGHLRRVPDRTFLSARSLDMVRSRILELGSRIPPRREPLRQMRGRIDETESGFGTGLPATCTVRAVVHFADADGYVAAVVSLEGVGGTEIHAARMPALGDASWEIVLEGLLELVRQRYPGCDRLTVISDNPDLADAVNGVGRPGEHLLLDALDERIERGEIAIEARLVPGSWSGWRVKVAAAMLADLMGEGAEQSCTLAVHLDGTATPTPFPPGTEPSWSSTQILVQARPY